MSQTVIRGAQILNNTVQRQDLDVSTVGQAVVTKIVQGSGISLSSTGADSGTGDVTVSTIAPFLTKTAAYTLTLSDSGKYVICSGGSWTLTLPSPVAGLYYRLRNDMGISGTTGTITLSPTGGTIDGVASIALLPQQEFTLLSDGTNWRTYGLKREVILGTQDIATSTAFGSVLLPAGYRYFELQFDGVCPVNNGDYLAGQFSVNGGSTWISTNYYVGLTLNTSTTAVGFSDVEAGTSFYVLPGQPSASVLATQGKVIIWPGNASQCPSYTTDAGCRNTTNYQNKWNAYGLYATAGLINAFKYFMSTGNIAISFLTVKGVV